MRQLRIVMGLALGLAILSFFHVIWACGSLVYLKIMPTDRVMLASGRNALFFTLLKGGYGLKIVDDAEEIKEGEVSVNGFIQTSSSTNIVDSHARVIGSHINSTTKVRERYLSYFECKGNVERVKVVLDAAWETNRVHGVWAVIFPCK